MARNQDGQVRMGKERFQFLNRWVGQDGIPHPIYSPHQNAVHTSKSRANIRFQGTPSLSKTKNYYTKPIKSTLRLPGINAGVCSGLTLSGAKGLYEILPRFAPQDK